MSDGFVFAYDRDGRAIDHERWVTLFSDKSYQRVAWDEISDDVAVSTVWLGLDHAWGTGTPIIFETMIFGGPLNETQQRYSSEIDALLGHAALVEAARASISNG